MADRPIIFSAPMVRALLDGRKTQTRRLAWQERRLKRDLDKHADDMRDGCHVKVHPSPWQKVDVGDRLYVREAFTIHEKEITRPDGRFFDRVPTPMYAADFAGFNKPDRDWNWKPAIHMPRRLSRLTLVVAAARMEWVQDISAKDCIAEGVEIEGMDQNRETGEMEPASDYWLPFSDLWCALHGPGAWDDNAEVVPITFTVHPRNIDAERS